MTDPKRPRIFRRHRGLWVIIWPDYSTDVALTWRQAMDYVCPPAQSRARVEIRNWGDIRAFNTAGEQVFPLVE